MLLPGLSGVFSLFADEFAAQEEAHEDQEGADAKLQGVCAPEIFPLIDAGTAGVQLRGDDGDGLTDGVVCAAGICHESVDDHPGGERKADKRLVGSISNCGTAAVDEGFQHSFVGFLSHIRDHARHNDGLVDEHGHEREAVESHAGDENAGQRKEAVVAATCQTMEEGFHGGENH